MLKLLTREDLEQLSKSLLLGPEQDAILKEMDRRSMQSLDKIEMYLSGLNESSLMEMANIEPSKTGYLRRDAPECSHTIK